MSILLCDVGGTYVRFALGARGGEMGAIQKLKAADYPTLDAAALHFLATQGIRPDAVTDFALAFSNRNVWRVTEESVAAVLPNARLCQVNDFEANAYGVLEAGPGDFLPLTQGMPTAEMGRSRCVVGMGTGLGLAYILETSAGPYIQKTHGGHMLPGGLDAGHISLFRDLEAQKPNKTVAIYEDVLSGPGLLAVYKLLCAKGHLACEYRDTHDLLQNGRSNPLVGQALRYVHEIFGVFIHQAVAFGCAYGGIYLTGGITDKLIGLDLFDRDTVLAHFYQNNVPIVRKDVQSTPVVWIKDEYISLKGLLRIVLES